MLETRKQTNNEFVSPKRKLNESEIWIVKLAEKFR